MGGGCLAGWWGQKYLNPAFIHAHSAGHSAARSELEVQLSLRLCSDLAHNGFLCANRARSHVSLEQGTSRMARFYCHAIFSLNSTQRPRGPMDKASAYGAGDCRFESHRGHHPAEGRGASQTEELSRLALPAAAATVVHTAC